MLLFSLASEDANAVISPPTFNAPVIPTPPVTINAPLVLDVDAVELDMLTAAENVLAPLNVCEPVVYTPLVTLPAFPETVVCTILLVLAEFNAIADSTLAILGIAIVPVNVGDAIGAFSANAVTIEADAAVKEPDMDDAVNDLIKVALAPNEPETDVDVIPPNEPETDEALSDLIKVALAPNEPEIPDAVNDLIKVALAPNEPEIPDAVKERISVALAPNEPDISLPICIEDEINVGLPVNPLNGAMSAFTA